ncbi:MAG: hypothetical protein KDB53_13770, partial [Planctomycetes bacterium]|nr:hypothetical protein [Planctomycetota bacterium]
MFRSGSLPLTALTFWIRAFIVVLWCSALGAAQSEPQTYRPWFDEVVLGNCRSLVVARVKNVDVLPNHQRLVRFTVDRVLRGDESDEILVLGADDRLIAFRDLQKLLFLEPTRHGSMRLVQDHVDLPKDEARERVDFVTAMVAVCDQVGSLRREAAAKTLLSTWIEAKSPWVRRVLVEEIDQLSRWRPASIDVALFGKIEKISQEGFEDETRRRLRSVMQGLEAKASVAWTHDELAFPDDASRQRFLELYTSFQRGVLSPEQSLKFLTQTLKSYGRRAAPILVPLLES